MAHFVRPLALAQALDPAQYDVHFYAPARFSRHLADRPFAAGELASASGEQFLANLAKGKPMFSADTLRDYVRHDRELIQRIAPDIVVGDMRLSLSVSARLERVKYAGMFNAYWSPYAKRRWIVPEIPLTRVVPPGVLNWVYRHAGPLIDRVHVAPINQVKRENGLPPLPPDIPAMYTDADYVLYPDVPEFIPTSNLPANHRFIGICEWTPETPKPAWWQQMAADTRPKVFVSLGSSGPVKVLPQLLQALSTLPVAVVLSTSGRAKLAPARSPGQTPFIADLLPFTETAALSALVVSHGGSGGLYPALAAGTPVLGIPSNADNHLSTAALEDSGAGLGIRVEEASPERLRRAIERLLSDASYRQAAQKWKQIFARHDSPALFRQFLADMSRPGA